MLATLSFVVMNLHDVVINLQDVNNILQKKLWGLILIFVQDP